MPEGFPVPPSETSPKKPNLRVESYDRTHWTPERIREVRSAFFEKLERNEQRLEAERKLLLEHSLKEAELRRRAEQEIAQSEMQQQELGRREKFQAELAETELQRRFRLTLEWLVEKGPDQMFELDFWQVKDQVG